MKKYNKFCIFTILLFLIIAITSCKKESLDEPEATTVTDIDGNVYNTVTIGTQVWMVENLKTTKFNDGTDIPYVTDNNSWSTYRSPAYCWYENEVDNKNTYGALYNWYTVDTGKLAPIGWHVPTDDEWTILSNYLGGEYIAGKYLKEANTIHWESPNSEANNESRFFALPGGFRDLKGGFGDIKSKGFWWSASNYTVETAWYRNMFFDNIKNYRYMGGKWLGLSVRCIRDKPADKLSINSNNLPTVKLNSISEITSTSAIIKAEVINKGTSSLTYRGVCISKAPNPTIENSKVYYSTTDLGAYSLLVNTLDANLTYYVRPFASNISGTGYGKEEKFTTLNAPVKPNNVDYFNIEVTRQKILISGIYIPLMKQYKLTVQEYSKVEYKWNCSDKSVQGITVSTRAFTPEDGYPYSNSNTQTFGPSGSKIYQKWDGLPGYLQLYIRTYNSKYYYSAEYLMVQKMIEASRTYEIWSDKPNL